MGDSYRIDPLHKLRRCVRRAFGCGCVILALLIAAIVTLLVWGVSRVAAQGLDESLLVVPLVPAIKEETSDLLQAGAAVFFQREVEVWYCQGPVWLASLPTLETSALSTDDEIILEVRGLSHSESLRLNFQSPTRDRVEEIVGPIEVSHLFTRGRNEVSISLVDKDPFLRSSKAYYLILAACPAPTPSPTALQVTPTAMPQALSATLEKTSTERPTAVPQTPTPTASATLSHAPSTAARAALEIEPASTPTLGGKLDEVTRGASPSTRAPSAGAKVAGAAGSLALLAAALRVGFSTRRQAGFSSKPTLRGTLFIDSEGQHATALLELSPWGVAILRAPLRVEALAENQVQMIGDQVLATLVAAPDGLLLLTEGGGRPTTLALEHGHVYMLADGMTRVEYRL